MRWSAQSLFAHFDAQEQRNLRQILTPASSSGSVVTSLSPVPTTTKKKTVAQRLESLCRWWAQNQDSCLHRYEERVYPQGMVPTWDSSLQSRKSRKAWFTILSLGALHSLGRQKPEQSRSFLTLCEHRGWLDKLIDRPRGEAFSEILEDYFAVEEDQQFLHWMRSMPGFYMISRWLDEYTMMLMEFEKGQKLHEFLNSRSAPYYQGSGIDAPNLRRTLKIGVHFVLRELRRTGGLKTSRIDEYCFVPSKQVRARWVELMDESLSPASPSETSQDMLRGLRRHLGNDEATFGRCFDLPLRLIPRDQFERLIY